MSFAKLFPTSASRFVAVWLATLVLVGGVIFPLGSLLFLTWSNGSIDWTARLYECKARCLEAHAASAGPRLLIFGGSASVFGLDAELMEEKLGIPTINLATHAALGLDFQISRLKHFAQRGDSALLVLELEAYCDEATPAETLREYAFSFEKSYVFTLHPKVMLSFLFLTPASDYKESFMRWDEKLSGFTEEKMPALREGYSLIKLNANGDFRGKAKERAFVAGWHPAVLTEYAKSALIEAIQWSRQHGVRLIFTWPNCVDFPPPDGKNQFQLHAEVTEFCRNQGAAVAGLPEESVYPKELFIDTVYHLNEIGQRIRTDKLIRRLREYFGIQPLAGPKITWIMASRFSVISERGIFKESENVSYKYLTESIHSPDCITPDALRELVISGERVVCVDDSTEKAVEDAGMVVHEIRRHEATLEDWIKRYDHHLFILDFVGIRNSPVPMTNLPDTFARLLSGDGYRAGVIGTGRWAKAHRTARGAEMAEWWKRRYDPIPIRTPFHFRASAKSGPVEMFDKMNPPILVEGESLATAAPGLAVAVVEPYLGIVCAQGTFQGKPLIEWKLRQIGAQ